MCADYNPTTFNEKKNYTFGGRINAAVLFNNQNWSQNMTQQNSSECLLHELPNALVNTQELTLGSSKLAPSPFVPEGPVRPLFVFVLVLEQAYRLVDQPVVQAVDRLPVVLGWAVGLGRPRTERGSRITLEQRQFRIPVRGEQVLEVAEGGFCFLGLELVELSLGCGGPEVLTFLLDGEAVARCLGRALLLPAAGVCHEQEDVIME
jgi:hypothetical protein